MRKLALFISLLFSVSSHAAVQFPRQMNSNQRQEVLKILGLGAGGKVLSDPYPLGGYSGLELGILVESIPIDTIHLQGTAGSPQDEVTFLGLTMGKGVYNNVDLFIHMVPYLPSTEVSRYGALVRWGFYQAQVLPLSVSINFNAEISNFSNILSTRTVGADIVGGVNVRNLALYLGAGPVSSNGTFIGGPTPTSSYTDTLNKQRETVKALHSVIGVSVAFGDISLTAQLDRYTQPVYSGKIGFRF